MLMAGLCPSSGAKETVVWPLLSGLAMRWRQQTRRGLLVALLVLAAVSLVLASGVPFLLLLCALPASLLGPLLLRLPLASATTRVLGPSLDGEAVRQTAIRIARTAVAVLLLTALSRALTGRILTKTPLLSLTELGLGVGLGPGEGLAPGVGHGVGLGLGLGFGVGLGVGLWPGIGLGL